MLKRTEKDIGWNYKICKRYADPTIITTHGMTSFAFMWFNQMEYLEASCN